MDGVVRVMEKLYPGRAIGLLEDKREDLSELLRGRGEELLRRLEGRWWIGFEESVRANVKSFYSE